MALLGIGLAALGLILDQMFGSQVWDALASLAIAVLLVVVAVGLGRQNAEHLIGKAVAPQMQRDIAALIRETDGIDAVLELLTMRLAPDQVLVAAKIDLASGTAPTSSRRLPTRSSGGSVLSSPRSGTSSSTPPLPLSEETARGDGASCTSDGKSSTRSVLRQGVVRLVGPR